MVNLDQIIEAHKRISPYINYTPLIRSNYLSKYRNVYLKLESLQITGSFKLRGATNKLLSLNDEQKKKGVIAVSTGNHGKGVAYASKLLSIHSTIFMSSMVPDHRKKAIEDLGAKVKIIGKNRLKKIDCLSRKKIFRNILARCSCSLVGISPSARGQ